MHIKLFCLLFCCSGCLPILTAQNLLLTDKKDRANITNLSIQISAEDNKGWVGAESLDLAIILKNNANKKMNLGAKKIESQKFSSDIEHTFCYAGQCYNTTTFISPFSVALDKNETDSSFLAHFLFENTTHIRGIYEVWYVFYDTINPSDSVFVHVKYNSVAPKSGLFYNAGNDKYIINQHQLCLVNRENKAIKIHLYDMLGKEIYTTILHQSNDYSCLLPSQFIGHYVLDINGQYYHCILE